jgi:pheromone shutdown-related protein TraB
MQLTIIGTSHIAHESVRDIKKAFHDHNPDIVAVELDPRRLQGLLSPPEKQSAIALIKEVGMSGFLFATIGRYLQKKLGDIVNMQPGTDMLTAVRLAQQHEKKVALIDRDILITLKRFSKAFTWKEKWRLVGDTLRSPFSKRLRIDLTTVPDKEVIHLLLSFFKKRYPGLHRVLVDERNHHMAKALVHIMRTHPDKKILAVVGAGHEDELARLIAIYNEKI